MGVSVVYDTTQRVKSQFSWNVWKLRPRNARRYGSRVKVRNGEARGRGVDCPFSKELCWNYESLEDQGQRECV